ncbi:MAG: hypothetical protein NXI24_02015 [bacterium]|nr:hypothetical protein [bacterium]
MTDRDSPQTKSTAAPRSPAVEASSPFGLLGLCSVFVGAIFAFIIAMEYDPLAREFKDAQIQARGRVVAKANLHLSVRYAPNESGRTPAEIQARSVRPLSRGNFASFEIGEEIDLFVSPRDPQLIWPARDFPATPRRASDAWFPLFLFALGLLGVIAEPEVLYGSMRSQKRKSKHKSRQKSRQASGREAAGS